MNGRFATAACAALLTALTACSGGSRSLLPVSTGNDGPAAMRAAQPAMQTSLEPHAAKIVLSPASLSMLTLGAGGAQTVKVSETGYTGVFSEKSTCTGIATASPTSGKGPSLSVKITAAKAGSCSITFSDTKNDKSVLPVTVTTTSFKLTSASISPGAKSIEIVLNTVGGKPPAKGIVTTVKSTLPACTSSCTILGPQTPVGSDAFTLTTFDGAGATGNALATVKITVAVAVGKANLGSPVLAKIPKSFAWGTLPSATAGTVLSPAIVTLTAKDADGHAIVGAYSTPVNIADSDTSSVTQGSYLTVNGGSSSHNVALSASTSVLKLGYNGLAMAPVTLTASATGASNAVTNPAFTPGLPAIVYSGTTVSGTPEIDLYNPNSGTGFSSQFSDTQPGWNNGTTFLNDFTYQLGGTNNNCSSYSVSPASGTSNQYTVQVGVSPTAGTCTMTVTGGAGVEATVLLTYTTTGLGVNFRHHHKAAVSGKP